MADDPFSSDSSDDDLILVLAAACARKKKKEKRKRRWWVRPWIGRREQHGAYYALMADLEAEDPQGADVFFLGAAMFFLSFPRRRLD